MISSDEVQAAIAMCRADVERDPRNRMSFANRRALLLALGPQELDARGYGVALTVGKRRRLRLALLVSRRVAPFWATEFGTTALDTLLLQLEQYLVGAATVADIRRRTDALQGALFDDARGRERGYLAGHAVAATGWVAVGDELLSPDAGVSEKELIDPEDPDLWDPAFFAAGAWAGGMPWSRSHSPETYREFWQWYLEDAVPQAWLSAT